MGFITGEQVRQKYGKNPDQYVSSNGLFDEGLFDGSRPTQVSSNPSSSVDSAKIAAEQRARLDTFNTKLGTIPGALQGLETELGIPQARNAFNTASSVAQTVGNTVNAVAPTQQAIAKQVGISAPRIQARTAAEVGKLQPSMDAASQGVQAAQSGLSTLLGTYDTRAQGIITPMQIEAGLLGDSIKNEFSLYTTEVQSNLDRELANLAQTGLNDRAALDRANAAAEAEKTASKGIIQTAGGRVLLIDPYTGATIRDLGSSKDPNTTNNPLKYLGETTTPAAATPSYFTPVG